METQKLEVAFQGNKDALKQPMFEQPNCFLPNSLLNLIASLVKTQQHAAAAAAAKSPKSCPTLCDPIDGSPPGSPIPGILQARTLEWVAISFSSA